MRFSPTSENHVATIGRSDHQLKVSHVGSSQPILSATLQVILNLTNIVQECPLFALLCALSPHLLIHYRCLGAFLGIIAFLLSVPALIVS